MRRILLITSLLLLVSGGATAKPSHRNFDVDDGNRCVSQVFAPTTRWRNTCNMCRVVLLSLNDGGEERFQVSPAAMTDHQPTCRAACTWIVVGERLCAGK